MGRRTRNALVLGALASLAGLAALGLWAILHGSMASSGVDPAGFRGLDEVGPQPAVRPGGIRLRDSE